MQVRGIANINKGRVVEDKEERMEENERKYQRDGNIDGEKGMLRNDMRKEEKRRGTSFVGTNI